MVDPVSLLPEIIEHLSVIKAEITLGVGSVLLLILGFFKPGRWLLKSAFLLVIVGALIMQDWQYGIFFNGFIYFEPIGKIINVVILISSICILLFPSLNKRGSEYFFLIITMVLGSFFMIASNHLLMLYLSIELVSLGSYLISNFNFNKSSYEASLKYILFGTISSAVMLFGISWIYGASGSLVLSELYYTPTALTGLVFFFVGLMFKATLAPFHMWAPAVYQEAPTPVVAFFTIVPKLAAFVTIFHIMHQVDSRLALSLENYWIIIAIVTVIFGTFSAIAQTNAKRLMAYGAIAHSGFILPLVAIPSIPAETFVFYSMVYAIMNLGAFYIIAIHESHDIINVDDYSGLGRKAPWTSAAFVIILISLIGIPPTGGFSAKLFLFSAVFKEYMIVNNVMMMIFVVFGILSSVIALYFYLKIPYRSYLVSEGNKNIAPDKFEVIIATFFAFLLLSIFIRPDILNNIVQIIE